MKRIISILALTLSLGLIAGGCASPCKDLEAKKSDCPKEGTGKLACEGIVDAAVKTDNKDICKTALDGWKPEMWKVPGK